MSADDVLTDMHDDLLQTDQFGVHTLTYTAPDGTATPVARAWFREVQQQVEPVRQSDGEALERRATAHWPSATVVPELRGTVTYDGDIWTILTPPVVRNGAARVELIRKLTTERSVQRYRNER